MVKLYRPSSGSDGEYFRNKWCKKCKWYRWYKFNGDEYKACPIEIVTAMLDRDDPKYPNQWRYKDGEPICTAFRER